MQSLKGSKMYKRQRDYFEDRAPEVEEEIPAETKKEWLKREEERVIADVKEIFPEEGYVKEGIFSTKIISKSFLTDQAIDLARLMETLFRDGYYKISNIDPRLGWVIRFNGNIWTEYPESSGRMITFNFEKEKLKGKLTAEEPRNCWTFYAREAKIMKTGLKSTYTVLPSGLGKKYLTTQQALDYLTQRLGLTI
jgi:hypothetical protein